MRATMPPSTSTIQFPHGSDRPEEPSLQHVGLSPADRTQAAAHAKAHAAPSLLVSGSKGKRKAPSDTPHEPFGSPIRNSPAANGSTHAPSPHTRPPLLRSIPENAASPAAFSTPEEDDVGAIQPKRRALNAGPGQAARHPWWSKPPVQQQQSQRENLAPASLYVSPWSKAAGPSETELRPSAASSPKPSGLELALAAPAQARPGGGRGSLNDGEAPPSQRQRLTRPITKPLKMAGLGPLFKR